MDKQSEDALFMCVEDEMETSFKNLIALELNFWELQETNRIRLMVQNAHCGWEINSLCIKILNI